MFHCSSYWGKWSRVLKVENGTFCELNLTPINGFFRGKIDEVRLEVIRIHFTMRDKDDINCEILPDNVLIDMKQHLDHNLVERLLNYDYLAEIGMTLDEMYKLRLSNGGGVPFQSYLTKTFHYWSF